MDEQRERNREGRNRDIRKERLWRRHLAEQKISGLRVRAYCRREGFSDALFCWWRREIARRDREVLRGEGEMAAPGQPDVDPPRSAFAEVRLAAPLCASHPPRARPTEAQDSRLRASRDPGIEIVLRGGRALRVARGFDPDLLLEVTRLLEDEASAC